MDRNYCQELLDAIERADRAGAAAVVDAWAVGRSFSQVVPELLSPTLESFGTLWSQGHGGVSLATGYVASKVAEDVLSRLLRESSPDGGPILPSKGPVLLGNVEDDFHPLGRNMVVAFLRTAGWDVRDLGVDVPPAQFVDQAEETGARVIGASAMMYTTAKNVARIRAEIDRRGLTGKVQLAVGGAVFKLRPELVSDLGGDGTATSALEASALFERLWQRSLNLDPTPLRALP
ncbi:MAG: cobalamin B12-binding domain-containing protein [Geothrix sp.]|uniref:cobalamin B12-binding domain-containing protein n=1 Tax=Geothrix sp. TaxID=1962974 RepID=UPI0017CC555D|nr:cobalamin-dependent protein [Geothrix sp.]NWJ40733.1 cobalamin B12-binding domain-containing protein [Geothrix sp.]WIL21261.1 MAG: cobalamin-dependent protein [Geothrix sp.]